MHSTLAGLRFALTRGSDSADARLRRVRSELQANRSTRITIPTASLATTIVGVVRFSAERPLGVHEA